MFIAVYSQQLKHGRNPSVHPWVSVTYTQCGVYIHRGISLGFRKEGNPIFCDNRDEPRGGYAK